MLTERWFYKKLGDPKLKNLIGSPGSSGRLISSKLLKYYPDDPDDPNQKNGIYKKWIIQEPV